MGIFTHLPNDDWRNDGWSLVGTAVTRLFEAWDNDDDSKYARTPATKGQATVSFPVDVSNVPDGAVIVSVSVKLRCGTGTGSAPAGTSPSVTVAVSADDDTSRFLTRTIYPTSTIQTFEVASYRVDALGLRWDVFRLNHILCRVFSYIGIFDLIRCYKFFCEVNFRVRPTLTVNAPAGTVSTPSPVVAWTYSQADGDPQAKAEYKIFTSVAKSQISFNPESSPPIYSGVLTGDISSVTLPTSLNADSYWVYVRSTSSYGAKSVWTGKQFSVTGSSPGSPGVPDPDNPGVARIRVIPDSAAGLAQLTLRDTSNMLDPNTADAESSVDGTSSDTTACTHSRTTDVAFPGGTAAWKLTSVGTGTMSFNSDWVEIDPGVAITGRAQFRTAVTAKTCRVRIKFYNSAFTDVGGTLDGSTITDSAGTWTEATVTGTPPGTAVYARLICEVASPGAAAQVHYVDRLGLMYGTNTPYSDGGHISRNLLSAFMSTGDNDVIPAEGWTNDASVTVALNGPVGTGSSGARCTKMTYNGLSPTIGFRAAGTVFTSATNGSDFTLNKPAGVVAGDFMLAFVTVNSATATCTAPAGWTLVDTVRANAGGTPNTSMFVLKRSAGGSEPSSWADGLVSTASTRRTAIVSAYSGASDVSSSTSASTINATPLYLTTPTLNNTDPNAWRVTAFAVNDNATGGTMTANRLPPSTVPSIAYVGQGTLWGNGNSGTNYTINRPSGVASGDLMMGFLAISGAASTVNVPAGWTLLSREVGGSGSTTAFTHAVIYRIAGGSEPASWSSSVSGSIGRPIMTTTAAYRNVNTTTPFIAYDGKAAVSGTSITTDSVTNNNSAAWRVSSFGMKQQSTTSSTWSTNEVVERFEQIGGYDDFFGTDDVVNLQVSDSNGSVSTGAYTRTGTASRAWNAAGAFVALLNPVGSPPAPVAGETVRGSAAVAGASNPWVTTRVFDSGSIIPVGAQSITGTWAPGSGTDLGALLGWQGIIRPADAVTAGYAVTKMNTYVDISSVDPVVLDFAGRKVAVTASFLGSVSSTPYLTVEFYRANQLLATSVAEGAPYDTAVWTKSVAVFNIPDGTTRMKLGLSAADLQVGDIVYFDRLSLAFGSDTAYRPGTSREVHPVWSRPLIEYADDRGAGYGEFSPLPGTLVSTPGYAAMSGLVMYEDHTVIPLTNRKYRARTLSYGLNGDTFVSDMGPESDDFRFIAENWWLKDVSDPSKNVQLLVKAQKVDVSRTNTSTVFQPLSRDLPVVLSEGFKGDSFTLTLIPVDAEQWSLLVDLIQSERTLFLQSDVDDAWWVRCVGDVSRGVLPTAQRRENPLREVTVTFVQVEAVE